MNFGTDLSTGWTSVMDDVLARDPIVMSVGRRNSGPGDVVPEPGTMTFTLNNGPTNSAGSRGYYAPYHSACRPGFGLRTPVKFIIDRPSARYPDYALTELFVGRIVDLVVEPGRNGTMATRVTVGDLFSNLGETPVRGLSVENNKKADELFREIFDNTNDPDYNTLYNVFASNGVYTFATAFDSVENARTTILEEVQRLALSERGRVYRSSASGLIFLTYPFASLDLDGGIPASRAILNDDMLDLTLRSTSDDLVQRVDVTVHPTVYGADATTVLYSLDTSTTFVQPGEVNTYLFGPYRDSSGGASLGSVIGGTDFQTVTATTDYTMNIASDGSGSDITAQFNVSYTTTARGVAWTIINNGPWGGYITKLQIRGRAIYRTDTTVSQSTATTYGTRTIAVDMPYQTDLNVANELALEYAAQFSRPGRPKAASVRFQASKNDTLGDYAVQIRNADIVSLTETQTGLSGSEYRVIGQKWEIYPKGLVFCTWYLEAVSMATWITPSYDGFTTYTASSGLWQVGPGDPTTYRYTFENRTMTIAFQIENTTVTATPVSLKIKIPEGRVSNINLNVPCIGSDNGTGLIARATVAAGDTYITISKLSGNWATSSENTAVYGEITFETTI